MLRHSLRLSLLASALLLLPACGGGGGGSAANEQTDTINLTEPLPEGYSWGAFECTLNVVDGGYSGTISLSFRINSGAGVGEAARASGSVDSFEFNHTLKNWHLKNGSGKWVAAHDSDGIAVELSNVSASPVDGSESIKIEDLGSVSNIISMPVTSPWKDGNSIHCDGKLKSPSSINIKVTSGNSTSTHPVSLKDARFTYIIYP